MSNGKCGITVVVDKSNTLGVSIDGDIGRAMENQQDRFISLLIDDLMSADPKSIRDDDILKNAQSLMSENNTNTMLAVNNDGLFLWRSTDVRLGYLR